MTGGSIPESFNAISSRFAKRCAVADPRRSMTYGELDETANRIAQALSDAGVARGDRVGLFCDRGCDGVAAMLGVVRSGAIGVPLVPSHPRDRHCRILEDAAVRIIVCDALYEATARASFGERAIVIPSHGLAVAPARQWPILTASEPAFIVYTSGSTGDPKGVVQTHGMITRRADVMSAALETTAEDRVGMFSTYAVGQGLTLIFGAILRGATLCPFDVRAHGLDRMAAWLVDERITVCYLSATLFRALAHTHRGERWPLRIVRLASERITPADIALFRAVFDARTDLVVGYSSTETGNIASQRVPATASFSDGIVPVGCASDGIAIEILDEQGLRLPVGQIGEIAVRSRFLSPGYWGDQARTARAFRDAPDHPDERLYLTGDLGRLRTDGALEHHGRKDLRVKIRGFRVELEEVERVLATHPHVRLAAAAARTSANGDVCLVGYLQFTAGVAPRVEDVRAFAAERLPDYMVPSSFIAIADFPLTDSGKIDRQRLPEPDTARPALATSFVAPRTAVEDAVTDVWRQVLARDHIGLHDAFLMVGGDSLRAAQIASRLSHTFGVELSLGDLMNAETVAAQAALINALTP